MSPDPTCRADNGPARASPLTFLQRCFRLKQSRNFVSCWIFPSGCRQILQSGSLTHLLQRTNTFLELCNRKTEEQKKTSHKWKSWNSPYCHLVVGVGRGSVWSDRNGLKSGSSLDSLLQQLFSRLVHKHVNTNLMEHQLLRPELLWFSVAETGAYSPAWRPVLAWTTSARLCVPSGVLVRQVKAVVVGRPEGGRPLVVQLSVNAARTRLSFLPTLGVEHGTASAAPAKGIRWSLESGWGKPVSSSGLAHGWSTFTAHLLTLSLSFQVILISCDIGGWGTQSTAASSPRPVSGNVFFRAERGQAKKGRLDGSHDLRPTAHSSWPALISRLLCSYLSFADGDRTLGHVSCLLDVPAGCHYQRTDKAEQQKCHSWFSSECDHKGFL